MTIFSALPVWGFLLGLVLGLKFASPLGIGNFAGMILGAIVGGGLGLVVSRILYIIIHRTPQWDFSKETVEELRAMLRDPECPAPNAVLRELGSRGESLEPELPVVLDMLESSSQERRMRGWGSLVSAFPERVKLLTDYRFDDPPEKCRRIVQQLRSAQPGNDHAGGGQP